MNHSMLNTRITGGGGKRKKNKTFSVLRLVDTVPDLGIS